MEWGKSDEIKYLWDKLIRNERKFTNTSRDEMKYELRWKELCTLAFQPLWSFNAESNKK